MEKCLADVPDEDAVKIMESNLRRLLNVPGHEATTCSRVAELLSCRCMPSHLRLPWFLVIGELM